MGNIEAIDQIAGWQFSPWFPLTKEDIARADEGHSPDRPGVYEIGLEPEVPQLNGLSTIIYIGRGAGQKNGDKGSVADALNRHIDNGSGPEKWLQSMGKADRLRARFAIAATVKEARLWEMLRIRQFIEEHWAIPRANIRAEVKTEPLTQVQLLQEIAVWKNKAYKI